MIKIFAVVSNKKANHGLIPEATANGIPPLNSDIGDIVRSKAKIKMFIFDLATPKGLL